MIDIEKKHKEVFGVEPKIIGLYWNEPEQLNENIKESINEGKPYNEYNLLTKDQKKLFEKKQLLF